MSDRHIQTGEWSCLRKMAKEVHVTLLQTCCVIIAVSRYQEAAELQSCQDCLAAADCAWDKGEEGVRYHSAQQSHCGLLSSCRGPLWRTTPASTWPRPNSAHLSDCWAGCRGLCQQALHALTMLVAIEMQQKINRFCVKLHSRWVYRPCLSLSS